MELHNLSPAKGATKNRKRIGRGQGSGHGATSTRGHKGDGSRSGHFNKRNFEGGQNPLQMRLPKIGFKNINRIDYLALNLGTLESISEKLGTSSLTLELLKDNGYVKRTDKVKILGGGSLTKNVTVAAHACSESAKQAIEQLGGSINIVK